MKVGKNISLKSFNTFGVDCNGETLIRIQSPEDLSAFYNDKSLLNKDHLILGGGSNVLFTKSSLKQVIIIEISGISTTDLDSDSALLHAGAGEIWDDLIQYAIQNSLYGIENLSIIPGKAGAAPIQNIGAYGVELSEVFESLNAYDITKGEFHEFKSPDCQFAYRDSIFKTQEKGRFIICNINLRLRKNPKVNLSYGALKNLMTRGDESKVTPLEVRNEVIKIRNAKLPNPTVIGNAGSFFKNPLIDNDIFESLKTRFSEMPGYPQEMDQTKIPAGWLIEKCGWKGKRVGNTGAHEDQALVIVNYGDANGKEIFDLAMQIQSSVLNEFGIILEPEVNII